MKKLALLTVLLLVFYIASFGQVSCFTLGVDMKMFQSSKIESELEKPKLHEIPKRYYYRHKNTPNRKLHYYKYYAFRGRRR